MQFQEDIIKSILSTVIKLKNADYIFIENSCSCVNPLLSHELHAFMYNDFHSSLTSEHCHVLNNLSPHKYRKVPPSVSWYDGSIVLEEDEEVVSYMISTLKDTTQYVCALFIMARNRLKLCNCNFQDKKNIFYHFVLCKY